MPRRFARIADIAEGLVDWRVGIVRYVVDMAPLPGAPDFFHYLSNACNTRAFSELENFNNAGGASADRETALAKALAESVERYCSAIYDVDTLPLSSYDGAPFACVEPERWALYSDEQYEMPGFHWAPFTRATPIRWTAALDLLSGARIHVPAAMVYMPYYFDLAAGDTPIVQPISTGMACHCSPAEAAIAGVCEVIERDALMITWQAMIAPPQISVETLSEANYDLVKRFEGARSRVTLFDVTVDVGVPTVLSVLQGEAAELPALVFAASTSLDPEDAVRKSLEELAHTRRYCHAIKSWLPRIVPSPPDHDNIVDQLTHLNFWTDAANAHLADFLFRSPERIDFEEMKDLSTGDPRRDLERLCRQVAAIGHQVLVVDLTTPDVRDLGLTVVRAQIPGFHPLFMAYRNRSLGSRRLWEIPQRMGHPGIRRDTGDNPSPHMYP
jgi:ribosomal protein S12 methylthiotransferase accessory factor